MRAKMITLAIIATMLVGCVNTYRETLQTKLEGKSPAEKRAVLAEECGSEISKGLKKDNPNNVKHFEKMRAICEEMTGQIVSVK